MRVQLIGVVATMMLVAGCDGSAFGGSPDCGGDQALSAIDEALKEELEFSVETALDKQGGVGGYDTSALDRAVERIDFSLDDVRTSDGSSGGEVECRASLSIKLPKQVESKANEALAMSETGSVRKIANQYKLKRRSSGYTADFEYTIEQTDDGVKTFVDIEDDASSLDFMGAVLGAYLRADDIRAKKIAEDQKKAAEDAKEREAENAYNARGTAALKTAKVERGLASERIQAIWKQMPKRAQDTIDNLHDAWVQEMKAECSAQAAGSDDRASMREAKELECQTRFVNSCSNILKRNVRKFGDWNYCKVT